MKNSENAAFTWLMFFLSPFASIPLILMNIWKGKFKHPAILISLLIGVVSYLYVPTLSNDKVSYYIRYDLLSTFSNITEFIEYILSVKKPDFIFDFGSYLFAQANININLYFLLVTFLTIISVFYMIYNVALKENTSYLQDKRRWKSLFAVICILLSFSLIHILPQIRFPLAGAFLVLGWALNNVKKNRWYGRLLLGVAVLTHFGIAPFVLLAIFTKSYKRKVNLLKTIFCLSLLGFLMPLSYLNLIISAFPLPQTYIMKADLYLNSETEFSRNYQIIYFYLKNMWLFLLYVYILFTKPTKESLNSLFIVFAIVVNLFAPLPWVFSRYAVLLKYVGVAFFLKNIAFSLKTSKKVFSIVFLLALIVSFLLDVYVMRYNLFETFKVNNILTIVNILMRKITNTDFLE